MGWREPLSSCFVLILQYIATCVVIVCDCCRLAEAREIVLYCDFHGHSKKQNVFIYGCDLLEDPHMRLKSRVFPKMLSKNAPAMFSYKDSRFNVHKSKVHTAKPIPHL